MKIGIIGLRPRQISELQQRELPLDIVYYGEKNQTPAQIEKFAHDKDHVIIMAGHVARPVLSTVPSNKRQVITGSVSSVIRFLEERVRELPPAPKAQINTTPKDVVEQAASPAPQEPTVRKVARAVNIQPRPEPPLNSHVELLAQVPRGYTTRYSTPVSPALILRPDRDGRIDYLPMKSLKVGDVVRSKRPHGLDLLLWQRRVGATRSYYSRMFGMVFEAHFFEAYVDMLLLSKGTEKAASTAPVSMPAKAEVVGGSASESPQAPAVEEPPMQDESTPTVTPMQTSDLERKFWMEVYVASIQSATTPAQSTAYADAALADYRRRFVA